MQLRKLRVMLIPVLAAAVAFAGSVPASAGGGGTGLGTGIVNGSVTTSPGVPVPTDPTVPPPVNNNDFVFTATDIVGSVTVVDTATNAVAEFVGEIDVAAAGKATDDIATGTGLVTSLSGNGTSPTGSISVSLASPTGVFDNTFKRVGGTVIVLLKLIVTITTTVALVTVTVTGLVGVVVIAEFVPTDPNQNPITNATFLGSFTAVHS